MKETEKKPAPTAPSIFARIIGHVTLRAFIMYILIAVMLFFIATGLYITSFFQRSMDSIIQRELEEYTQEINGIIANAFERYFFAAEQLAFEPAVIATVDNYKEDPRVDQLLVATKVDLALDSVFLISEDGKIISQRTRDFSVITQGSFRPNLTSGARTFLADSTFYQVPVLYVVAPVSGEKHKGNIAIGKALTGEFLQNLSRSGENRGIFLFSNQGNISTASGRLADLKKFVSPLSAITIEQIKNNAELVNNFSTDEFYARTLITPLWVSSSFLGPLGIFIDTKGIVDIRQTAIRTVTIMSILAFFLIVFVFLFMQYFAVRPISFLTKAFDDLSEGNLEVSVPSKGLKEIKKLNVGFNLAVRKISSNTAAIETQRDNLKELNKKIEKERNQTEAVVTSIGEGLVTLDKNLKITFVNAIARKLLELPEDVLGYKWADVTKIFKGDQPLEEEKYPAAIALKTKNTASGELEENLYYQTASKKKFPVAIIATPLTAGNSIIGVVVVFRDISESKNLEEARIGFISVASHQLRTPLTSMRWFSEMLLDGDAGKISNDQKHFVERIYQGTDRMIALVNLLLQIARVEAGRIKVEPVPIDLKNMVRGITLTLRSNLDAKFQTVKIITIPDPFPQIPMDKDVIWQVLQNLLSNASRYAPAKSIIEVIASIQKGSALIAVKDKGIGIPYGQQGRIFEKFFRAENALKLIPEGSGLGLSLAKSLVQGWGGKIWFESEENKGTAFYFTVPLEGMEAKEGEVKLTV